MNRRSVQLALLVVACLLLTAVVGAAGLGGSTASAARPAADPGVDNDTIKLGSTVPLSGPFASVAGVARGAEAYFKYLNARGGINGRKLDYTYLDDAYVSSNTVQLTRQLVERERVFAIFNTVGTEHNQAIRPYLNQLKVPHLFLATGATAFGRDYKDFPYSMGYLPSYVAEGKIYARHILKTKPKAKIAVFYQDDDYGGDILRGLRQGLGSKAKMIVRTESYDPSESEIRSQISKLKSSGANTLMIFAFGRHAIQAFTFTNQLNWKPVIFVNQVAASANVMLIASGNGLNKRTDGAISLGFVKDPADPKWARDKGMKLYRTIMKQHLPSGRVNDGYHTYGMAVAFTMADALRRAGRNLTREGLIRAATRLTEKNNPFLLPGIGIKTSATDRFPIGQAQLQRYSNKKSSWRVFGPLISASG